MTPRVLPPGTSLPPKNSGSGIRWLYLLCTHFSQSPLEHNRDALFQRESGGGATQTRARKCGM